MTIPKIWKRITFLSVLTLITNSYTAAKEIINIPLQNGEVTMNIRMAIESAKTDDIKIVLEKGTYFCKPDYATEKYCAITNHGNGSKKIIFPIKGFKKVEIEGNGATILCHGGKAQGFEDGWIAGAIISGAYFGDKISPLSETTILASSITDTPLFRHIRYMMITTVPSLVITLIIFTVAGFSHDANNTQHIAEVATALNEKFHITPWLLIVPVVTGILIAKKVPSIVTLFLSTLLAAVFALIFQPDLLEEISGIAASGFDSLFISVSC